MAKAPATPAQQRPPQGGAKAAARPQPRRGDKRAPAAPAAPQARPKGTGDVPARLKQRYRSEIVPALMKERGYRNPLEVPRLEKIVINMGVGEARDNAKVMDFAAADLQAIAGQKPVITRAKKSIANFKLRE